MSKYYGIVDLVKRIRNIDEFEENEESDYTPKKRRLSSKLKSSPRYKLRNKSEDSEDEMKGFIVSDIDEDNKEDTEENTEEDIDPYVGLTPKIKKDISKQYKKLCREIKADIPTLETIITAKLSENDKKLCIQLYHMMLNKDVNTLEYMELCQKINKILQTPYNPEEEKLIKSYEEKFKENTISIDLFSLKSKIFNLDADDKIKKLIHEKLKELERISDTDNTSYKNTLEWLMYAINLPYRKVVPSPFMLGLTTSEPNVVINRYINQVWNRLNERLYGMKEVKQTLLQLLVKRLTFKGESSKGIALGLKGGPGCGKTSIGAAFAYAIDIPYEKISVNGMSDPSIFKGTNDVYVGAQPSIILQIMKRMGVSNGIIIIDEVDKLEETSQARSVQHSLLNIADFDQNHEFQDNFISQFPHDLSKLILIFLLNDENKVDPILRDRLHVIEVKPYTEEEKKIITIKYILPETLKNYGFQPNDVDISDKAYAEIKKRSEFEVSGMRCIKRIIDTLISKLNMLKYVTLPDGSTGSLNLDYHIPNLAFPLKLEKHHIQILLN